ncbi:Protein of unknown function [Cotesia congregata]|uniref:Uncharacterized protein n=1 Tax=Cotesia congregata TaxID=51543 RepID=A0A8J2MP64_COTCN|nr:Protein of unknown function [Cotesia congregata]
MCGISARGKESNQSPNNILSPFGHLTALFTMNNLALAQINILSKVDMLSNQEKQKLEQYLCPIVHFPLPSDAIQELPHPCNPFQDYEEDGDQILLALNGFNYQHDVGFTSLDITDPERIMAFIDHIYWSLGCDYY